MVNIIKQLVPSIYVNKRSYGYGNPCNYITIHQTGNTNKGANAKAHANIQSKLNPRQASWQYQVDDIEAIQSFDDEVKCWAAGDGSGPGNTQSIHIEICINEDGNYKKAVANGAELAKQLMDKHNLSINDIKQHHDWSSKNCPAQIRAGKEGISWSDFLNMVEGEKTVEPPKTQVKSETVKKYEGNSIVDYLNKNKKDASYKARQGYAKEYGIANYKGTAQQNVDLLNAMIKGKKAPVKAPQPSYIGKRVESVWQGDLNFYRKPSWDKKDIAGTITKRYGFPNIVAKVKVGSAYQYKVKNSKGAVYYITASTKYVTVK